MFPFDDDDVHSVALCVWKEARGEGLLGMRAVMHVIANRVGAIGFARNIHDVVYGKNQFTSMSVPSDREFNLAPQDSDVQFAYCMNIAPSILQGGEDIDPTNGAHYYDNPKTAASGWFLRAIVKDPAHHPLLTTIGRQNFYQ